MGVGEAVGGLMHTLSATARVAGHVVPGQHSWTVGKFASNWIWPAKVHTVKVAGQIPAESLEGFTF